jgi:hypothetical protein
MVNHLLAAWMCATAPEATEAQSAAPAPAEVREERLLSSRVEASLGIYGSGYTVAGGRWGDPLVMPGVSGRYLLGGFAVDGSVLAALPPLREGVSSGAYATLRAGYVGRRWAVHAGALGQWALEGKPQWQWLPSLRGEYAFDRFGISAGVFDHGGLVPLHVTLEIPTHLGHVSLGYLAPMGALVGFSRPLSDTLSLRAQAFIVRLVNADQAFLTVGLAWGGAR